MSRRKHKLTPEEKSSKAFDSYRRTWLKARLRQISIRWPAMSEAMSLARVDRGLYKCASCGLTFSRQRVHRDHINPVVDPDIGFVDWNSYIERLFVDATQIQIMCELCHSVKTSLESAIRGIKGSQRK